MAQVLVLIDPADPADVRLVVPNGTLPAGSFLEVDPVTVDSLGNELWSREVVLESSDSSIVEVVGHALALREPGSATIRAPGEPCVSSP